VREHAALLAIVAMVKRTLALTAALLLAACETDPYGPQGPYDEPYPPSAPYPAPYPYPPTEPFPPAPPSYPSEPYQPGPPECPITASRDWSAWINRMPGPNPGPMLVVSGKVVTATGGYQVAFDRGLQVRESYPAQAFVTLHVADPDGPGTGSTVTHQVRWEWPLNQPVGSVVVRCGDKTLAEISNIQTAF
jgi:hypothetical protein